MKLQMQFAELNVSIAFGYDTTTVTITGTEGDKRGCSVTFRAAAGRDVVNLIRSRAASPEYGVIATELLGEAGDCLSQAEYMFGLRMGASA